MQDSFLKGRATVWPEDSEQMPQTVYFQPPKTRRYDARWLLLWQESSDVGASIMEQAKLERPLTQTEYRVRDYLLGLIGIGNYVYVNQAEVARELRIDKKNMSVAIRRLCELGILIRGPKSGRSCTFMVSPAFCFSGGLSAGIKARREAIKEGKAKILPFAASAE